MSSSRQLAADSVQGKKKSALGHGFENAIEAPRRYNDFQRTATTPLTLCLSPRVHSIQNALPPIPRQRDLTYGANRQMRSRLSACMARRETSGRGFPRRLAGQLLLLHS